MLDPWPIRERGAVDRMRRADMLLVVTAGIWGFAFVAQRAGMSCMGPFLFNAVRFALGALILGPVAFSRPAPDRRKKGEGFWRSASPGLTTGAVLFAGASLQQAGLVYTTAGNAGFVTGLYVVLVPVFGLLGGSATPRRTWVAAVLSVAGMFFLTSAGSGRMATGDLLVLGGAFFWALHIQVVSRWVARTGALRLAASQFAVCSVLSVAAALLTERIEAEGIFRAAVPLAYGGLVSVGIAYTLQIVAQKDAHPSHAALIMSLEAVFAALGGWLLLGEGMTLPALGGGVLMLCAMLLSANPGGPPGHRREGHGNR
jgi:drug/metabolite transporter (DMT)-like permease